MYKRCLQIDSTIGQSFFLFGPRGVGKTSWLLAHFSDALRFDLLKDETYTDLLSNPSRLEAMIPGDCHGWIVIDEIQKVPALLDEVHRLIESRKLRFVLTGSSARKLRRSGVNLLAGRALVKKLYPLTAVELAQDFDVRRSLQYGHLPMALTTQDPKAFLQSYVTTYLREEVMQEGLTRNIAVFAKFLAAASFSQGEMLNYTQIAQEIGSKRATVENFFEILEDLLIASHVPVFMRKAKRATVKTPKFYFFDVGVYRTIRPVGPLDNEAEIEGAALETLFLQEARAANEYHALGYEFYFWRTHSQLEVDFVLYGEKGLLAFEIKRKAKLHSKDFKGLHAFMKDYPMCQAFILYGGTESYIEYDIRIMPLAEALRTLPALLGA